MSIKSKSILLGTGLVDNILMTTDNNTKIFLAYIEIIQKFYDNGYRNFIIEVNINKAFNDSVLKSALKLEAKYDDVKVFKLLASDDESTQIINEENSIIAQRPYSKNEYILSICDKLVLPFIRTSKRIECKITLVKSIKLDYSKMLVYELPLPLCIK